MAITDAPFSLENELEKWVFANSRTFFADSILLDGFRITTPSGKHGVPDAFVFNFAQRAWWVVECELLAHGVWPHIAEQITRFVVAIGNSSTLRQIRDRLFERLIETDQIEPTAAVLNSIPARLLQQLELFLESVPPSLAIFIDDTDQDLIDFCDALEVPTEVYRVKKFIVNGQSEYYSPDKNLPAITSESKSVQKSGSLVFDVIEKLGGGEVLNSRMKCYKLHDSRIVKIQYSKLHERHQIYWYGIAPSSFEQIKEIGCTHFIFVMNDDGFVVVPLGTVEQYLKSAYITNNPDGTIRHYHVLVSLPPEVVLKAHGNASDIDLSELFRTFD